MTSNNDQQGPEYLTAVKHHYFKLTRSRAVLLISIFAILILVSEIFIPHSALNDTKLVTIQPTLGSRKIGAFLKQEGIIRSKWAFVFYVSILGQASSLKPGNYTFSDSDSIPKIAKNLVGGRVNEITIIVPEGWTADEIAQELELQNAFSKQEFLTVSNNTPSDLEDKFSFLKDKPRNTGLEGYLFPDTYRLFQHATPETVVNKMLINFDEKITSDLRLEIENQNKSLYEIVIMASLIEREVITDEDRALVAGVLWKRLELGIPLQVDATVLYTKKMANNNGEVSKRVTIEDTKISSPYNTYTFQGLPVGPIANPGMASIEAAIHPTPSSYLYYLSTPEGQTIFSSTLEEHNIAKATYLK